MFVSWSFFQAGVTGKSLLGPPSLDAGCREEEHRISVQLAFT
jgi:hypothetical protein